MECSFIDSRPTTTLTFALTETGRETAGSKLGLVKIVTKYYGEVGFSSACVTSFNMKFERKFPVLEWLPSLKTKRVTRLV
jgi:hypothetical protein